jgi:hypothetical protein
MPRSSLHADCQFRWANQLHQRQRQQRASRSRLPLQCGLPPHRGNARHLCSYVHTTMAGACRGILAQQIIPSGLCGLHVPNRFPNICGASYTILAFTQRLTGRCVLACTAFVKCHRMPLTLSKEARFTTKLCGNILNPITEQYSARLPDRPLMPGDRGCNMVPLIL